MVVFSFRPGATWGNFSGDYTGLPIFMHPRRVNKGASVNKRKTRTPLVFAMSCVRSVPRLDAQ
jgi:hypothetical protein